jgi:uncharacterized protein (TIGR02001 family)
MNKAHLARETLRRPSTARAAILVAAASFGLALSASAASAQEARSPPNAAAPVAPAPAPDFTVTGSAGVWSQYRFRGISQSDNKPVIQGALTVTHKSGFYLSTWGSSASANDAVNLGGTEIDVYGGYAHTLGSSGVTADAGVYGYLYPGSKKAVGISENYYEVYADLAKPFGPETTKVGINYAPRQAYFRNFATPTRYNVYVYGELGYAPANMPFLLHSHLGHTAGGLDFAGHSYLDYTVGASYKWKALLFDVSVVGTDLSKSDTDPFDILYGTTDFHRAAKTAIVGSISASF